MKRLFLALCITSVGATSGLAQTISEGRRLAELSFESMDSSNRGFLNQGNMEATRGDIFTSMDSDESGKISEEEWLSWDYGFSNLAEQEGKEQAYQTALRVVFSFHDRNGDGQISQTEHRKSTIADFQRADLNNDAILTKTEYLNGFSVLVAIRAALKPVN